MTGFEKCWLRHGNHEGWEVRDAKALYMNVHVQRASARVHEGQERKLARDLWVED